MVVLLLPLLQGMSRSSCHLLVVVVVEMERIAVEDLVGERDEREERTRWRGMEGGDGKFYGDNHHTRNTEYTPLYTRHSPMRKTLRPLPSRPFRPLFSPLAPSSCNCEREGRGEGSGGRKAKRVSERISD